MSNICDTTDLMVHGHVPWLELPGSHVHAGGHAEVRLFWGRDMQPDGLMRRPGLAAYALSPSGTKQDIDVFDKGPNYYSLFFNAQEEGLYQVVAKHYGSFIIDREGNYISGTRREQPDATHGVCCIQYAQVFVPVGHCMCGKPRPAGLLLELVPDYWKQWRMGDEIGMQAQYSKEPLAALRVDLACDGGLSGWRHWQEKTDVDGRFKIVPREACRYLVTMRYQVLWENKEPLNSLQIATTMSFMALKQECRHEANTEQKCQRNIISGQGIQHSSLLPCPITY